MVTKAKKRADEAGPVFFSGAEALAEVAKDDGAWNWALVGPDPATLPLSGGGARSAEEMREALGKHAMCFGLLRMTFGVPPDALTKWVFIHASDDSDANFSVVEKGKANAMEPKMEEALKQFCAVAAKVRIQSKEECTAEVLVERLRKVLGGDAEMLTVERLSLAMEEHRRLHPEMYLDKKQEEKKKKIINQLQVQPPRAEVAAPEVDMAPEEAPAASSRQRKKVKLPVKGDVVEIFSQRLDKWFLDAEVVSVTTEVLVEKGMRVPAGSLKIVYDNGTRFKWVAPQESEKYVRPSERPRPPEPMAGDLLKETNYWFITRWNKYYFEVNKGFLQWWNSSEEAGKNVKPVGSVYLMGLQQKQEGDFFRVRTEATGGAVFAFQASTEEESSVWVDTLWAHAAYSDDVREHFEAQLGGNEVRNELLNVMMRRELMSVMGGRAATLKPPTGASSARSSVKAEGERAVAAVMQLQGKAAALS